VEVAGRRVYHSAAFDSVVTDCVLLNRAAAEANVLECARAAVECSGRLQVKLRKLAPVEGKVFHFALGNVQADARGSRIDWNFSFGRDGDFAADGSYLQCEVLAQVLADGQLQPFCRDWRKTHGSHTYGVERGRQWRDQVRTIIVGLHRSHF